MAATSLAPALRVQEVRFFERDLRLRMPFRFGVVTLTHAPQAFVRLRLALEDGREAWGMAAELLAPKWFDKNLELSSEENFEQLRTSLRLARERYLSDRSPRSAYGLFAAHHASQIEGCADRHLNALVASFGPALLDRAVLDALCRAYHVPFHEAMRRNLPGIAPAELLPELTGFDINGFLSDLKPHERVHARHTVGLVDPITIADQGVDDRVGDGLPETLEEVISAYHHRYFKIKVGGDVTKDLARLGAIATILDRIARPYYVTLDGNEQYGEVAEVLELWERMERTPQLRRLSESVLYVEQPMNRQVALARDVRPLDAKRPVIIDESDSDLDAFATARDCGYRGVSSKTCKGLYKSILNLARCRLWNRTEGSGTYFMSGEDLTCQAGVSVQQDLALVALLGLDHVERNGHHYANGMAAAPAVEQQAFLDAHSDLYRRDQGVARLRIEEGQLHIGSLACPGFAVATEPDWSSMREIDSFPRT